VNPIETKNCSTVLIRWFYGSLFIVIRCRYPPERIQDILIQKSNNGSWTSYPILSSLKQQNNILWFHVNSRMEVYALTLSIRENIGRYNEIFVWLYSNSIWSQISLPFKKASRISGLVQLTNGDVIAIGLIHLIQNSTIHRDIAIWRENSTTWQPLDPDNLFSDLNEVTSMAKDNSIIYLSGKLGGKHTIIQYNTVDSS
jgi:hypothetical protein